MPLEYNHDHENEITLFAETNFRNQKRKFGIKTDDRRRHIYIIGKTGMGKTTLQENFVLADIMAGHGCCYIDPHGDTAEKLLDYIPSHRLNDVIYFNPGDVDFPIGFNILETENDEQKHLVAAGLMGVFKKIWPDVWSARMEYVLLNCVNALLDYPGATLMGINRLLVDKDYRARVVAKIKDPIVKTFWVAEFATWSEKYATEAIAPIQNKVGQFLSSSIIRNIVAQVKSTINLRRVMDDGKIVIVNLAKGRIGEDNMRLLGGMLVTKIQLAAQERQNIPESERRDFYLYVDEFQNFANESFASILSEARKFRLNLVVAHQYIEQLDEKVAAAIFGNIGTIIAMRVGGADATAMETEFAPTFTPEDLVNLAKFQVYLKLMVDGVATPPFSANTLAPIATKTGNQQKVIAVSRERYAEPRHIIESKVLQWSGMEANTQNPEKPVMAAPVPAALEQAVRDFEASRVAGAPEIPTAGDTTSILPEAPKPVVEEATLNDANVDDHAFLVAAKPVAEGSLDLGDVDTTEYLKIRPERLEAIKAAIPQAQGKSKRPDFPHTCARCGKVFNLAIQLDTSRPIYCADCRPLVAEERKSKQGMMRQVKRTPVPGEKVAAIVRTEQPDRPGFSPSSSQPNRPRIIQTAAPKPQVTIVSKTDDADDELDLLSAIKKAKGDHIETNKATLENRAGMEEAVSSLITQPALDAKRKNRRRRNKNREDRPFSSTHSAPPSSSQIPVKHSTMTPGNRVKFD